MEIITVRSKKIYSQASRSWKAKVIRKEDDFWLLLGKFQSKVIHPALGIIAPGTLSYEYFWKNKWFTIFQFHNPDGTFRNFYCNINTPPIFSDSEINYLDLEIDLVVWRDLSYKVLDMEEFAKESHFYSQEIISNAYNAVSQLQDMINSRSFPFNQSL